MDVLEERARWKEGYKNKNVGWLEFHKGDTERDYQTGIIKGKKN